MALLPLIILAIVQGVTEFLPVSSSGHLVLVHNAFDGAQSWQQHIVLDVAVHIGTLFSVLLYFRKDVLKMLCGVAGAVKGDVKNDGMKLNAYILIGSIPVIIAGLIVNQLEPSWLLLTQTIGWTTLIFGILLWVADRLKPSEKTLEHMTMRHALIIGCAQALALIPGTSRSGITMTAARFLGYNRSESAHFSLLLAIIAISGAGALSIITMLQSEDAALTLDALLAAFIAFVTGWIAIALMMKWLERSSFAPFAIYRIILGIALLAISYGVIA